MQKTFSVFTIVALLGSFFAATPIASAACMGTFPTIGTIASVTSDGNGNTKFGIDQVDIFSPDQFVSQNTSIDSYQALVKGYLQHDHQVPQEYAYVKPAGMSDYDYVGNAKAVGISVPTSALNQISYRTGDVIVMGPPAGRTCGQNDFVGFFGTDGVIRYAIAYDALYKGYSYGSDTLTLTAGSDHDCVTTSIMGATASKCIRQIQYALNQSVSTLNPGESKTLGANRFAKVALLDSSHTTLVSMQWVEDFVPTSLLHVITFSAESPLPFAPTFSTYPLSGNAPLTVSFYAPSDKNYYIDFGDGTTPLQYWGQNSLTVCKRAVGRSGCVSAEHTYQNPGSYLVKLRQVVGSTQNYVGTDTNLYVDIATLTITVNPGITENALYVTPTSGHAPLTVKVSGQVIAKYFNNSSIDFGDGSESIACGSDGLCGSAVPHVFAQPGTYTVTLTGTAGIGNGVIISQIVKVSDPVILLSDSCTSLARTLSLGSRGSDVLSLQNFLIAHGFLAEGSGSGYFGRLTRAAVMAFQKQSELPNSGIVGKLTRAAIAAACGN